jgi:formate-dependent nitrite reductase membrane component NrfD
MSEYRSYYGRPVIKEPTWTWQIPWYLFFGGLAGGAATLAVAARAAGNDELARRAHMVNVAAISISPALLVSDLGRPERFLNMLRVFKPTSPMSVGTWIVSASGTASGTAAACELVGRFRGLRDRMETVAAVLGPFLSTYTAALLSNTAVPVWSEARVELPFVFAGSSAASAGAATALVTAPRLAGPARRLSVIGGALELASVEVMEKRLGFLGEPYHEGKAGAYGRAAKLATAAGTGLMAVAGRSRWRTSVAGALLLAGSVCTRWSAYHAGFQSARDPKYTIVPQRRRVEERAVRQT